MTPQATTLGIDFGTSNSAAATVKPDGQVWPIPLEGNSLSIPTALFFSSEDERILFGAEALNAYLEGTPGRLMRSIKSLLGSPLMDEQTLINGRMTSFFDLLVLFLKEIKSRAELHTGQVFTRVLLGRPVHFVDGDPPRDAQAQATLGRAAHDAGFAQVAFELEPIAAAYDFERRIIADTTALVVDVGGGTSDFTVMHLRPGQQPAARRNADILATTGIHVGGTDFDRLLDLSVVMPLLGFRHTGPHGREVPSRLFFDLATWHLIHRAYSRPSLHSARQLRDDFNDPLLYGRLMRVLEARLGHHILAQVEAAKIACSSHHVNARIDLTAVSPQLSSQLTVSAMADTLDGQVKQIVDCALACVRESGLMHVPVVYLTGGSCAFTPLTDAMKAAFPKSELVQGDLFLGVASGLACAGQVAT